MERVPKIDLLMMEERKKLVGGYVTGGTNNKALVEDLQLDNIIRYRKGAGRAG